MTGLLLALALASDLPGFPRPVGGTVAHGAIGVTLDGQPAVVLVAGEEVVALRSDGGAARGFPLALGAGERASGPPAAADLDRDGRPEIAVVTTEGKVHLWSAGRPQPGFPVSLGARCRAGPAFVDVDGDGRPELVVGDEKGRLHALGAGGREPPGWPVSLPAAVTSSASASRFAGGGSLAVGLADGTVHLLALPGGKERPGFPLQTGFEVTGAPAFADLDGDGDVDLVVASRDFKVYVVGAGGKPLPGFPVSAGYRIYEGPAVADLDGDGRLDLAFASADGVLHAVSPDGVPLPGFPVRAGGRVFGGVVVGDLDRDGRLDLAAVTADGQVVAFSGDGKPLAGFPARLPASDHAATPLLLDLAGDRSLSVFVGLPSGEVHALRALKQGAVPALAPWPSAGRDASRSGRYGPHPPRYAGLALTPAQPRTGERLQAAWRWISADGEPEPPPALEWLRDGAPATELHGRREVPAGVVKKGERWRFRLALPGGRPPAQSPEAAVVGSPPRGLQVAIEPALPVRGAPARVVLTRPATDPDGDPLRYQYEWLVDGLPAGVTGETFPAHLLRRGTMLSVRARASDGELSSESASASARVQNSPPGAPVLAPLPPAVRRGEPLAVRLSAPSSDLDEDPIAYRHRWLVDGEPRNLAPGTEALPPGTLRKGQKVRVEVRPFDGQAEGPAAVAEVRVENTPPGAPAVEIAPAEPRTGEPLRAVIRVPATDVDGDVLAYRYAWSKNGRPLPLPPPGREVPAAEVRRGDRFEVEVKAFDGEAEGPPARAAAAVRNTPPGAPRVAIEPARPLGGAPLRVVVQAPGVDPDGDQVAHAIAWSQAGGPLGERGEVLPAEKVRKHQRLRATVTPSDGTDEGPSGVAEVEVRNAPPGAPAVALLPERAGTGTPLVARVTREAPDADRDLIRYRYRFRRNGFPVAVPDGTRESAREPFWTTAAEVPGADVGKRQRWTVEVQAGDGETFGPSAFAELATVNTPPPAPSLTLVPARPRRTDPMAVRIAQPPDADGDAVTWRIAWSREGQKVDLPPGQAEVPRGLARKGERWRVEVVASDGEAESPPARLEWTIANAPPGPAVISLCDGPVAAGTPLEVKLRSPAQDPDGDPVSYRYEWSQGAREKTAGAARLPAGGRKHDLWRVVVTPGDGADDGPPAAADCLVVNSPPGRPRVALEPATPTAESGLAVRVTAPSADRDGDQVTYRYAWERDGQPVLLEGAQVPPGKLRHGERWTVTVRPFDGEEEGEAEVASAVVGNTPPPVPAVGLQPGSPAAGQALACAVTAPQRDADGERVEVRRRWLRNGEPVAAVAGQAELPAGLSRRGERWRCEAWTGDGTAESARAGAEVTVQNGRPGAPRVAIEPAAPRVGEALECRFLAEAVDPDGDPLRYAYGWWRDDRKLPLTGARVEGREVRKGQRWRCQAVASDGTLESEPATADAVVRNSPPGPMAVRLLPVEPRPGQALRCEIAQRSEDADGDAVRHAYAWTRNGEPQSFSTGTDEVPGRLVKAGDRWRCAVTPGDGEAGGPTAGSLETPVAEEPGSP